MMKHKTRIILVNILGNLVQSFDMAICSLLSFYFVKYFLGDTNNGVITLFKIFSLSYVLQMSGSLFFGLFSDSLGRKKIFSISIIGMSITTVLIGFIPAQAILILFLLRTIQSFFYGSEYFNSTAYLIENAPESQKRFIGSWGSFGYIAGLLIASLCMLLISHLNTIHPNLEWLFWRFPFCLGLIGVGLGLYIWKRIPESLDYIDFYAAHSKPDWNDLIQQSWAYLFHNKLNTVFAFILISLGVTAITQIYIFGPIQAHLYHQLSDQQIYLSSTISILIMLFICPLAGKLSQKIKREKIITAATLGLWFLSQPYFYLLAHDQFWLLLLCQCLMSVATGAYFAIIPVMVLEMFPLHLRCTLASTIYAMAAALSAGIVPILSLKILKQHPHPITPSVLLFSLTACLWGIMWIRNVKKIKEPVVTMG